MVRLRLEGVRKTGKITPRSMLPKKWCYLINAPFKISDRCCYHLKKAPAHNYAKKKGYQPILATTAEESALRLTEWIRHGCNAFTATTPKSAPLSFWKEQDVLLYLKTNEIHIAKVYGDIIEVEGKLKCSGADRTGCMFCMYGVQYEQEPNRFQRMKITHPKQYEWCMKDADKGGLGLDKILSYMNIPH